VSDREGETHTDRDALALVNLEAAISAVGATVGAAFGPVGSILGAFIGPYAKLAIARFLELRTQIDQADLDEQELIRRLDENELLAQLVAEVVRGTVESDLASKRRVLAQAAIRALRDDAAVDEEARFIRTANEVDTFDIRVLAYLGQRTEADASRNRELTLSADQIAQRWPGAPYVAEAAVSSLKASGLAEDPVTGALRAADSARITGYGRAFLERLLNEGLEDELRRRPESGARSARAR
jgi:phage tail tape-measure protein